MATVSELKDRARALEQAGQMSKALAIYQHILKHLEGKPALVKELGLYVKSGDLLLRMEKPAQAVGSYEKAAEHYAKHGSAQRINALIAKITRAMPEKTGLHVQYARRLLEHRQGAAARDVLAEHAQAAGLDQTLDALDQLAGRTEEEINPILSELINSLGQGQGDGVERTARRLSSQLVRVTDEEAGELDEAPPAAIESPAAVEPELPAEPAPPPPPPPPPPLDLVQAFDTDTHDPVPEAEPHPDPSAFTISSSRDSAEFIMPTESDVEPSSPPEPLEPAPSPSDSLTFIQPDDLMPTEATPESPPAAPEPEPEPQADFVERSDVELVAREDDGEEPFVTQVTPIPEESHPYVQPIEETAPEPVVEPEPEPEYIASSGGTPFDEATSDVGAGSPVDDSPGYGEPAFHDDPEATDPDGVRGAEPEPPPRNEPEPEARRPAYERPYQREPVGVTPQPAKTRSPMLLIAAGLVVGILGGLGLVATGIVSIGGNDGGQETPVQPDPVAAVDPPADPAPPPAPDPAPTQPADPAPVAPVDPPALATGDTSGGAVGAVDSGIVLATADTGLAVDSAPAPGIVDSALGAQVVDSAAVAPGPADSAAVPSPPDTPGDTATVPVPGAATGNPLVVDGLDVVSVSESQYQGRAGFRVVQQLDAAATLTIESYPMDSVGATGVGRVIVPEATSDTIVGVLRLLTHMVFASAVVPEDSLRALLTRLVEQPQSN